MSRLVVIPAILIALSGALLVAYAPALRSGFVWDDDFYVTENKTLSEDGGLGRIWLELDSNPQYYPVTFTSFWLEYRLWKLEPFGYHLVNLLLHALASALLWLVLRELTVPGAVFAAAIFALHPIQVESVAWITERKNVLSAVLFLLSALAYLRYSLGRPRSTPRHPRFHPWLPPLAIVLFCAALLSKSVTASLPAVLLLVVFWRKRSLATSDRLWLGLMLVIGATMGGLTAYLERMQVGAVGEAWSLTAVERVLLAGRVFWFYPAKLAWPAKLSFVYERWEIDPAIVGAYLFPIAAAGVVFAAWFARRRIGEGPLVAILYYGITISPVLGFLAVFPMKYSWVADHFAYLAAIGPIALFAAATTTVRPRLLLQVAVLLVLATLTRAQTHSYHDLETLWRHTIERVPRAWMAQYALGNLLSDRGELNEAAEHYLAAVAVKPDYVDALNNLGVLRAREERAEEAAGYYEQVLVLEPTHAIALFNLGSVYKSVGRDDDAIAALRGSILHSREPDHDGGNMARRLIRRGTPDPPPGRVRLMLADLLYRRGETTEPLGLYRLALQEDGSLGEAWIGMGAIYLKLDRLLESADAFDRGRERAPLDPRGHYGRGRLYEREGSIVRALTCYRQALRGVPDYEPALTRIAALEAERGETVQ